MKNILRCFLWFLVIGYLFSSCNTNPVHKALDSFEAFLTKWENRSVNGIIDRKDLAEYRDDEKKLNTETDKKVFENMTGWTTEDILRLETLRKRSRMLRIAGEFRLSD